MTWRTGKIYPRGWKRLKLVLYLDEELGRCEDFLALAGRLETMEAIVLSGSGADDWMTEIKTMSFEPDEALYIGADAKRLRLMQEHGIATLACDRALCGGTKNAVGNAETEGIRDDEDSKAEAEDIADWIVEGFEEIDEDFLQKQFERFHGIPWTILETQRCIVRELAPEDVPALFELYEKPHVTDYVEPLFSPDEEMEYQKAYIRNIYHFYGFGMWLAFDKESGDLVGRAGLELREYPLTAAASSGEKEPPTETETGVELGYIIAPEYQHRGYASEICRAILEYGKKELGFDTFNCLIEPGNENSGNFAKKLGFVSIGKMHMDNREFERFILNSAH